MLSKQLVDRDRDSCLAVAARDSSFSIGAAGLRPRPRRSQRRILENVSQHAVRSRSRRRHPARSRSRRGRMTAATPAARDTRHGSPHAIASSTLLAMPSRRDGNRNTSEACRYGTTGARKPSEGHATLQARRSCTNVTVAGRKDRSWLRHRTDERRWADGAQSHTDAPDPQHAVDVLAAVDDARRRSRAVRQEARASRRNAGRSSRATRSEHVGVDAVWDQTHARGIEAPVRGTRRRSSASWRCRRRTGRTSARLSRPGQAALPCRTRCRCSAIATFRMRRLAQPCGPASDAATCWSVPCAWIRSNSCRCATRNRSSDTENEGICSSRDVQTGSRYSGMPFDLVAGRAAGQIRRHDERLRGPAPRDGGSDSAPGSPIRCNPDGSRS